MSKQVILCADDFGLNHAVDEAIIQLSQHGRLSATSVMVTHQPSQAILHALNQYVYLGLHLNLTEGTLISHQQPARKLPILMLQTALRWPEQWILKECRAQLECFYDLTGRWPDYIDGHQHVHQFPQIRNALLTLKKQLPLPDSLWWRSTCPTLATTGKQLVKKVVLHLWGAKKWNKMLLQTGAIHPQGFAGLYDFNHQADYAHMMQNWLHHIPDHGLLMCHPATEIVAEDTISAARVNEFTYLNSEQFDMHCQQAGVTLKRKLL